MDEIVIGGISGRFPECNNVEEFKEALLRGDDLLTVDDRRFPAGIKGLPKRSGKIPEIDKFDSSFFGIHHKQANFMDPRHRILLETVFEAIIDAGYNPNELRGSKTGVFVGLSLFTNFDEITKEDVHGYSVLGASLCSAANMISYCFDFTGPSYSLDTGCSSSLYAFSNAVDQLRKGDIKYAIVGGTHLGLSPKESQQYNNLNMLSADGTCKVFSKERNGVVRSEAVCTYFLQMKSNSRRIYATVLGSKTNTNGCSTEGYTYPSAEAQLKLMQELYTEAKVSTNDVAYVELHGIGSQVGDKVECKSLVSMFCQNRQHPLLIGSVKSNMGHAEPASGLAAVTKVLLAMEYGTIPANIHYHPIDDSIPGIADRQLQVVTRKTQWIGGIAGVNSFGFAGANAHVILKPHVKNKVTPLVKHEHRLINVSGRTEEAVNYFIDQIEKNQSDEEFLSLLDEIHKSNIEGHNFRGYTVLGKNPVKEVKKYTSEKRPIWFVYPGLGSQWAGMGKDLMHIEIFRNTINRCARAVKPYGVDLIDVIMSASPSAIQNLGNSFSAITAITIALTDLLASVGIEPDFIVGHSLGEVGCAYANGDLTPEQTMLISYATYHACIQTKVPPGRMASVGISKEAIKEILPEDICIGCENARDNVTVSGAAESTERFLAELKQKGVFTRELFSGEMAYHTKYLLPSKKYFEDFVSKVIPDPKPRSKKWISSVVPSDKMNEKWANVNCAEYHAFNYTNTNLFDRIFEYIQPNAIVVEVGPHALLQAILKRELSTENILIPILNKNAKEQEQHFWSSIGKMYNAGVQPNLRNIYKETVFPVSPGTKMIAPLVKWDHTTSWFVPYWKNKDSLHQTVSINLSDLKYSYLKGHNMDGQVVMPAAAYLELVWRLKAEMCLKDIKELPIVMKNVQFKRTTILKKDENTEFIVNIIKESGNFEIFERGSLIVTGNISIPKDVSKEFKIANIHNTVDDLPVMKREDFYKEAYLRKYFYCGIFQGIEECDINGVKGKIEWKDNYVTFIDSMCQLSILSENTRNLLALTGIKKLVFDPISHMEGINKKYLEVRRDPYCQITKSKGLEIYGLKFKQIPQRSTSDPIPLLETFEFVYYDSPDNQSYNLSTSLTIAVQIIIQNIAGPIKKLIIAELKETEDSDLELTAHIKQILKNQVFTKSEYLITRPNLVKEMNTKFEVIVANENVYKLFGFNKLKEYLRKNGFFLYLGQIDDVVGFSQFEMIFRTPHLCLLREKLDFPNMYDTININNDEFTWLDKLKECAKSREKKTIFLLNQNEDTTGIIGLQKSLMTEETDVEFKSLYIDQEIETFSVDDQLCRDQLSKSLAFNVLRNSQWGTFVHLPLEEIGPKYAENAEILCNVVGGLSTLHWVEKPLINLVNPQNSKLVNVYASELNYKFVTNVSALVLSYSGITVDGRRVMGLIPRERISFQVMGDPELMWDVPDSWSLVEAASVPFEYLTCYYALIVKGQMEQNDSILIHDAITGTGIAAIAIALHLQATVFTTVGSEEEKEFLKKLYPLLDDTKIGNSTDSTFEHLIKKETRGKGVDIVLNCFGGELLETSLNCLAKGGRFLQTGDSDIDDKTILDSSLLLDNCIFHRLVLDHILEENSNIKLKLNKLVNQGIEAKVVKPLSSVVFYSSDLEAACKSAISERHKKVLIKLRDEKTSISTKVLACSKLFFNPDKVYIIIGGLGGIGLELANWLIEKGATKVVLNVRRNVWKGYQAFCMKKWSQLKDVVVKVDLNETTTITGAESLIYAAQKLGPIGGVFNAANVLQDADIIDQTENKFEEVFKPKILSSVNMDVVTKKFCSQLDHFVVFSAVVAGRGNKGVQLGQTNYCMANSAVERLCERRRRDNLPGLAVQWGLVEIGFSPDQENLSNMVPQHISSCLDTLEKFLLQNVTVGSSLVLAQEEKLIEPTPTENTLVDEIANILGINLDSADKDADFFRLGLDSLMLAEIKHALYQHYEVDLSTAQIRTLTFNYLIKLKRDNMKLKSVVFSDNFPPPLLSNTAMVRMKENEGSTKILFMVHPLEGNLHYFKPLASRLNVNVYGIQCTKESNFTTIEDAATYFLKFIKEVQTKGPYYLCGYSYGATLGFEMGLQLERDGEIVYFLALDGAPDYSRQTFTDINNLDFRAGRILPSMFKGINFDKVKSILEKYPEKSNASNERMSAIFNLIAQETGIKLQEIVDAGNQLLNRCRASYNYRANQKFKGKIKLVRKMLTDQEKAEDYNLQKIIVEEFRQHKLYPYQKNNKIVGLPKNRKRIRYFYRTVVVVHIYYPYDFQIVTTYKNQ